MEKNLKAFSGIRFYFASLVFCSHVFMYFSNSINFGFLERIFYNDYHLLGFFVLSGFLTALNYKQTQRPENSGRFSFYLRKGYSYALRHVKKWYVMYMISFIPFVYMFMSKDIKYLLQQLGFLLSDVFIVQSLLPWPLSINLNGTSWYLSCIFIIYIFTPLIMRLNYYIKDNIVANVVLIIIILGMDFIVPPYPGDSVFFSFPLYRILQFVTGILAFNIASRIKISLPLPIVIFVLLIQISAMVKVFPVIAHTWALVALIVFVIVCSNTKAPLYFLSNRITCHLASGSLEFYLFHNSLLSLFIYYLTKRGISFENTQTFIILMIGFYIGAVLLSEFMHYIFPKIKPVKCIIGYTNSNIDKIISKVDYE